MGRSDVGKKKKKRDKHLRKEKAKADAKQLQRFGKKYYDGIVFQIYSLAKSGLSDYKIAGTLGIALGTFSVWIEKRPWVALALIEGRNLHHEVGDAVESFHTHIEESLPPDLVRLWDKINVLSSDRNPAQKINALLADKGDAARQQLFIHALVSVNFNVTQACAKVAVSRAQVHRWTRDKYFAKLLEHVNETKKDFFEGALIELIAKGDSSCVVFANKTYNRDRGYNDKVEVEIAGSVNHNHTGIDIGKLDLPLDVKRQILKAVRAQQMADASAEGNLLPAAVGVIEA